MNFTPLARGFAFVLGTLLCLSSAVAEDKKKEKKYGWETSLSAGLTLTRGNSDTVVGNLGVQAARKWEHQELTLNASGTYGESSGVKNTEIVQGHAQYNRLFTEKFYAGFRLDAVRDAVAALEYRFNLSPVAGYYFVKNDTNRFSVEGGPSFVFEKQGGISVFYVAARLGERYEHNFANKAKVWQSFEIVPQIDDLENYVVNAEVGAEASLTGKISLRATVQDTYDNQPAAGRKQNDLRLVTSLVYRFR